jgi:hypothetical protein
VSVGANGSVGDKPWHLAGNKGIQPGARTDDMNVSFPDVTPPFTGGTIPGSGTTGGTNYSYVLGSGNYMLPELDLKGQHKMAVTGAAVLYVTGDLALGGNAFIYIAPGAKLQLYVGGASADFAGNGVANSGGNATNFYYYGLPSNTSLKLSGNSAFTGAIYAPNADFTLGGGGSDPYDFVGASVTGTVRLNGHYNFHYDENLERVGPRNGVVITSWNEI